MIKVNVDKIEIETDRFLLKTITVTDVSERYVGWLKNEQPIGNILYKKRPTIEGLKEYVKVISDDENQIFLGIFTKDGEHIGNIKFAPVDVAKKYTIVGVLIGEKGWQGKGVFKEVIEKTGHFLKINKEIVSIYLGVKTSNTNAISAYRKSGFVDIETEYITIVADDGIAMVKYL